MKLNNAIVRYSGFYIVSLSVLSASSFFPLPWDVKKIMLIILYFMIFLPLVLLVLNIKHKKMFWSCFIFLFFIIGVSAVCFRYLRNIFSNHQIAKSASVGYAQYFGYPLYLDSILFFVIVFSPIIFYIIVKLARYRNKRIK